MAPFQVHPSSSVMTKLYEEDQEAQGLSGKALWEKRLADLATDSILLPDGRSLAYHIDGDLALGRPVVLLLHGMFSSRLCWVAPRRPDHYALVAVDRPGWGESSDPPKDYSYMSFARDMEALMDHLQIDRFSVLGHSSGGPNALAVASLLGPRRVPVAACLAGDTEYRNASPETPTDPMSHFAFGCLAGPLKKPWEKLVVPLCTRWCPAIMSCSARIMACMAGTCTRLFVKTNLVRQEAEIWREDSPRSSFFMEALVESTSFGARPSVARSGARGFCHDFAVERNPFDFDAGGVQSRTLFWAGEFDDICLRPTLFNHHVLYPGSELRIVPNRGHVGVLASDTLEPLLERVLEAGVKEV